MAYKLDKKDKRILHALDRNSRASYAQIAREVGLKQGTVRYRVQKLTENRVITKFQTIINSAKLGITYYKVFLRLQATQEQRNNIIEYLTAHPRTTWVGKTDGPYDIGINVLTQSPTNLSTFLSELFKQYPDNILEKKLSANLSGTYHGRTYLLGEQREITGRQNYSTANQELAPIDETDFLLLTKLCQSSRASTVELGEYANISHDAAMDRLRKLEETEIITRYTIILNNEAIQQLNYKVLLYLRKFSHQSINSISRCLESMKNITYVVHSLGNWDIDFEAEVESAAELRKILNPLVDAYPDHIQKSEQLLIYDFTKYDYLPKNYSYEMYLRK